MRLTNALCPALLLLAGCAVQPGFLPAPGKVLVGYQALRQPRPELPVGALWVDGYGPYGAGAAADNIDTIKTLSAVTFEGGVQGSLTLGVLQFLDLDPSFHDKLTARLNDVSIVRVNDMAKLGTPAGQPRVYEALKAASITVTTNHDIGLDVELRAAERNLPVFGRGTSGRLSTFTIEARDVFFAIRVARLVPATKSMTVTLDRKGRAHAQLGGLGIAIASDPGGKGSCTGMSLAFATAGGPPGELHSVQDAGDLALDAPVAVDGTLYDRVSVEKPTGRCDRAHLLLRGTRLEVLPTGRTT